MSQRVHPTQVTFHLSALPSSYGTTKCFPTKSSNPFLLACSDSSPLAELRSLAVPVSHSNLRTPSSYRTYHRFTSSTSTTRNTREQPGRYLGVQWALQTQTAHVQKLVAAARSPTNEELP